MPGRAQPIRLLITGFGPFPGAAVNPTAPLVRALARKLRARSGVKVAVHVFPTTYAAVDRGLPRLLARHRPQVVLMFGLASRSRAIRIETQARNRIGRLADASGATPASRVIVAGAPRSLPIRAPKLALLRAAQSSALPARLSVNAGSYLCNYLYWRALEAVQRPGGPGRTVFIHVPPLQARRGTRPARSLDSLLDCAEAIAAQLIRAARQRR